MSIKATLFDKAVLEAIYRESWAYTYDKPGKVPPADSPNRPASARLWRYAHQAIIKRPALRTFTYAGSKFGIVFIGHRVNVMEWRTRKVLVRPPTSMESLLALLNPHPEPP